MLLYFAYKYQDIILRYKALLFTCITVGKYKQASKQKYFVGIFLLLSLIENF